MIYIIQEQREMWMLLFQGGGRRRSGGYGDRYIRCRNFYAPSHAIQDGVIVNYYECVQLVTRCKNLKETLDTSKERPLAQNSPG